MLTFKYYKFTPKDFDVTHHFLPASELDRLRIVEPIDGDCQTDMSYILECFAEGSFPEDVSELYVVTAEIGDKIVGWACGEHMPKNPYSFTKCICVNIFVEENNRRKKIGTALLEKVKEKTRHINAQHYIMGCHDDASSGFVKSNTSLISWDKAIKKTA